MPTRPDVEETEPVQIHVRSPRDVADAIGRAYDRRAAEKARSREEACKLGDEPPAEVIRMLATLACQTARGQCSLPGPVVVEWDSCQSLADLGEDPGLRLHRWINITKVDVTKYDPDAQRGRP